MSRTKSETIKKRLEELEAQNNEQETVETDEVDTEDVDTEEVDDELDGELTGLENETEVEEGEETESSDVEQETTGEREEVDEEQEQDELVEGERRVVDTEEDEDEIDYASLKTSKDPAVQMLAKKLEQMDNKFKAQALNNKLATSGLNEKNQAFVSNFANKYKATSADVDEMIADLLSVQPKKTVTKGKTTKRVAPKGKTARKPNTTTKTKDPKQPKMGTKEFGAMLAKNRAERLNKFKK